MPACGTFFFLLGCLDPPLHEGLSLVLLQLVMECSVDITRKPVFSEGKRSSSGSWEDGRLVFVCLRGGERDEAVEDVVKLSDMSPILVTFSVPFQYPKCQRELTLRQGRQDREVLPQWGSSKAMGRVLSHDTGQGGRGQDLGYLTKLSVLIWIMSGRAG